MIWETIWRHEAWLQALLPIPAISLVQFFLPGWQLDDDLPLKRAGISHPKTKSIEDLILNIKEKKLQLAWRLSS